MALESDGNISISLFGGQLVFSGGARAVKLGI